LAVHSKIGASSAKRLIACPGSLRLSEKAPKQKESKYAIEGTRAHTVAEYMLLGKPLPLWADSDMVDGAKLYSQTITDVLMSGEIQHELHLESKICISSISDQAFGTCDAWCVVDNVLHVFDYKYGAGIPVSPENNEQLMYYAQGVIETFNIDVSLIHLWIIQPRCGGVSDWAANYEELTLFKRVLQYAIIDAEVDEPPFNTGSHCKWCPAQSICPAKRKEIEDAFQVQLDDPKPGVKDSPQDLEVSDIIRYIDHAESLQAWIKALKHHLQVLIEMGVEAPGYAVQQGQANRSWREDKLDELVAQYGEFLYEQKMKSPAGLEKVKGVDKKVIAEFTERKATEAKLVRTDSGINTDLFTAFTEE